MPKYVLGRVTDHPPGTQRTVRVGDISVGVFNVEGSFYAVLNRCPHQGGPLARGSVVGLLESSCPGEFDYDPSRKFVKCPWHGWEFDLTNGKSWFDPQRERVKPYEVKVERGQELMDEAVSGSVRMPGPYVAKMFEVSVEDDYLVIEVGR